MASDIKADGNVSLSAAERQYLAWLDGAPWVDTGERHTLTRVGLGMRGFVSPNGITPAGRQALAGGSES